MTANGLAPLKMNADTATTALALALLLLHTLPDDLLIVETGGMDHSLSRGLEVSSFLALSVERSSCAVKKAGRRSGYEATFLMAKFGRGWESTR